MGIMCVPSKKILWYLTKRGLEPRVFPWQQHRSSQSAYVAMHISGAGLKEHCCSISGGILD